MADGTVDAFLGERICEWSSKNLLTVKRMWNWGLPSPVLSSVRGTLHSAPGVLPGFRTSRRDEDRGHWPPLTWSSQMWLNPLPPRCVFTPGDTPRECGKVQIAQRGRRPGDRAEGLGPLAPVERPMMGPLQAAESVPGLPMGGSPSSPPPQALHFLAPGCGWSLCPDLFTCLFIFPL